MQNTTDKLAEALRAFVAMADAQADGATFNEASEQYGAMAKATEALAEYADGYLRNEGTDFTFVTCRTNTKPGDGTDVGNAWGRLREARAAVAELIEAHRAALDALRMASLYVDGEAGQDESEQVRRALSAGESALARVQGGAA